MISSEDIDVMKHLCDEVIYVSNGYVKTDDIYSGIPMVYTMEKIMRELLKQVFQGHVTSNCES